MTGEIIIGFAREVEPYHLEFSLQGLPKILSNGSHSNWRVVHALKKKWKQAVRVAVANLEPKAPLTKAKLTLIRHSSKESDFDGLVISFKPIIDGLKEAGVILDDKTSVIGQPSYSWQKAKMKQGKITVIVEEI